MLLWIVLTNLAAATQNGSDSTVGWGNRRQESWDTCVLCEWGSSGQILCVCVIVCNWWTQSSRKSTAGSPFVSLIFFFFSFHHTFVFFLKTRFKKKYKIKPLTIDQRKFSSCSSCWFPHSTLLSSQVLRQLQQGLAKCYSVAFEKSGAVSDAKITPHTLNFVKKLVSTFGVGLENVSNVSTMFSSAASESLARRAQATAQDPVFQKMKGQFTTGWCETFFMIWQITDLL